jgi:hypothetical protein
MLFRRLAILGLVLAGVLVAPAAALADPTVSIAPAGQLGPQGVSAVVSVNYSCDPDAILSGGYTVIYVSLDQSTGTKLARGTGQTDSSSFSTPPLVCDGATHTAQVRVTNNTGIPYKQGKAAATATLQEYNPATGQQFNITAGPQQVSLKK